MLKPELKLQNIPQTVSDTLKPDTTARYYRIGSKYSGFTWLHRMQDFYRYGTMRNVSPPLAEINGPEHRSSRELPYQVYIYFMPLSSQTIRHPPYPIK
ncbi:MAG TPA: hypothetical protein DFI01_11040 [Bacteroidales bacterium]|nr:hypothetical protein [Bacteroidales bacterium]